MPASLPKIEIGSVCLNPKIENGSLHSLGKVEIDGIALRSVHTRWLPWFDAYEGGIWNRFDFVEVEQRNKTSILRTRAVCDNDYPFRERRDVSGDLCFRELSWDAPAAEIAFDFCFEPAQASIEGRVFHGFKYWYEYSGEIAIHRVVDRATWELGGALEGNSLLCRNWLTPPRVRLLKETEYSTVGLDKWAKLLPGNLWARWSLLPSFDMQYGPAGTLLGWFDEVSLIRSVIETGKDEDVLRILDMHLFEQSSCGRTNPKTILYCPDVLDDIDGLNLWTCIHDAEAQKARAQFAIPDEEPPQLFLGCNVWENFRFEQTYNEPLEVAAEFGLDYIFIDSVFEHQRAYKESLDEVISPEQQEGTIFQKFAHQNMCVTLDFEVADVHGGEAGLKKLCERAAEKNIGILSWMACHLSPNTELGKSIGDIHNDGFGIFAAKESQRHPDTGYPQSCWPLNFNTPIYEKLQKQLLGVCERTGLGGFLWDSFSNLGWWQLDYAGGSMRPQFDKMMQLYAAMRRTNLHLLPEAIVTFSNHSCCGMHGGEIYDGDLLGFSCNTSIALTHGEYTGANSPENRILCGKDSIEGLFRVLAHKRSPSLSFHLLPRDQWNSSRATEIKTLLAIYKKVRPFMQQRTVLKNEAGVLWSNKTGPSVLWSFQNQELASYATRAIDLKVNDEPSGGELQEQNVYLLY